MTIMTGNQTLPFHILPLTSLDSSYFGHVAAPSEAPARPLISGCRKVEGDRNESKSQKWCRGVNGVIYDGQHV